MQELPIQPDAEAVQRAIEVFRNWIVDNRLQCSRYPSIWADEPQTWGICWPMLSAAFQKL